MRTNLGKQIEHCLWVLACYILITLWRLQYIAVDQSPGSRCDNCPVSRCDNCPVKLYKKFQHIDCLAATLHVLPAGPWMQITLHQLFCSANICCQLSDSCCMKLRQFRPPCMCAGENAGSSKKYNATTVICSVHWGCLLGKCTYNLSRANTVGNRKQQKENDICRSKNLILLNLCRHIW